MLLNSMFYMPTIALNNAVSYRVLEMYNLEIVKIFPPIRMWGTGGFVVAMWVVDLAGWSVSPMQLYVASASAILLGLYAFTMPACKPAEKKVNPTFMQSLGLDALVLFKRKKMAIFFVFAMLLGASLQITNTFGEPFLHDFGGSYPDAFAVKYPGIMMSISQISETLFILTIPFFLIRFGIQKVMIMSIFAWVFRFGLFGIGNPGDGVVFLIASMIIYGLAFDFFNISGSLFVKQEADGNMVASAQGIFMLMTNGIGAFLGGTISGMVVDYFTVDGVKNWQSIWFTFAAYSLVLGIAFPLFFRYKHDPGSIQVTAH
jgi:NHS family xanthosine MFS transporter